MEQKTTRWFRLAKVFYVFLYAIIALMIVASAYNNNKPDSSPQRYTTDELRTKYEGYDARTQDIFQKAGIKTEVSHDNGEDALDSLFWELVIGLLSLYAGMYLLARTYMYISYGKEFFVESDFWAAVTLTAIFMLTYIYANVNY